MIILDAKAVASRLLGRDVTSAARIGEGRNSRVYRLTCGGSCEYAAKFYFRHSADSRDRLGVEFSSLLFLWENGVRGIPQPIASDRESGCAVYEYIEGKKIPSRKVSGADIDYAVRFLARLKELKDEKNSIRLPIASEACFSIQAIVDSIEQRLRCLSAVRNSEPQYDALQAFLNRDFALSFSQIIEWCQSCLDSAGIAIVSDLGYAERTLSPSDFGFHNALRRNNGEIVFLDFEYFGWDDPAKMVVDMLLHPGMKLSMGLKRRFVDRILSNFTEYSGLAERIRIVFPLFGLKWCLILLNEFLPEQSLRRQFASTGSYRQSDIQLKQLAKALKMLQSIMEEYGRFPYFENAPD